jgi:MATE family multidrug resistance protein
VLRLAWPASLTMLNATVMKFVDSIMVSFVGPGVLAAQFQGGMWSFVPESFFLGALSVVSTYVSQDLGRGRMRRTGAYAWAGLAICLAAGLLLAPAAIWARSFFSLMGHGHRVAAMEALYFRYMILTIGFTLGSRVLEQFFYGIHRPMVVLVVSLLSNGLNLLGDWVLIFGKWGFPALGLEGAALATISAWIFQFLLLGRLFLRRPMREDYGTGRIRAVHRHHIMRLLKLGWPAGLQLSNDILCWSLFTGVLVGRCFGAVHLAASTIAMRYLGLSFMPTVGAGMATTALVGRSIGAGRIRDARRLTHLALMVAMAFMGLCGVAFWLWRTELTAFFVRQAPLAGVSATAVARQSREVIEIGRNVLLIAAAFQFLDAAALIYTGALRGAGDTRWPMLATIVLSWTVILGGGSLLVWVAPGLGSLGPWLATSFYVVLLGLAMAWRFESGKWKQIDLTGRGLDPTGLGLG